MSSLTSPDTTWLRWPFEASRNRQFGKTVKVILIFCRGSGRRFRRWIGGWCTVRRGWRGRRCGACRLGPWRPGCPGILSLNFHECPWISASLYTQTGLSTPCWRSGWWFLHCRQLWGFGRHFEIWSQDQIVLVHLSEQGSMPRLRRGLQERRCRIILTSCLFSFRSQLRDSRWVLIN